MKIFHLALIPHLPYNSSALGATKVDAKGDNKQSIVRLRRRVFDEELTRVCEQMQWR